MFRNLEEEVDAIERSAVEFAARMHLNKAQVMSWISQASAHPELPALLALPTAPYIVPVMPEQAFCSVVSVSECTFHQTSKQCECSKTMKFGGSTEVCTKITKHSTSTKCQDDLPELSKECVVSSMVPCDAMPPEAEPEVIAPCPDCTNLERENIYCKNKVQLLENTLAQIISTLTGKTLNQVAEIMGKNGNANPCDLS